MELAADSDDIRPLVYHCRMMQTCPSLSTLSTSCVCVCVCGRLGIDTSVLNIADTLVDDGHGRQERLLALGGDFSSEDEWTNFSVSDDSSADVDMQLETDTDSDDDESGAGSDADSDASGSSESESDSGSTSSMSSVRDVLVPTRRAAAMTGPGDAGPSADPPTSPASVAVAGTYSSGLRYYEFYPESESMASRPGQACAPTRRGGGGPSPHKPGAKNACI